MKYKSFVRLVAVVIASASFASISFGQKAGDDIAKLIELKKKEAKALEDAIKQLEELQKQEDSLKTLRTSLSEKMKALNLEKKDEKPALMQFSLGFLTTNLEVPSYFAKQKFFPNGDPVVRNNKQVYYVGENSAARVNIPVAALAHFPVGSWSIKFGNDKHVPLRIALSAGSSVVTDTGFQSYLAGITLMPNNADFGLSIGVLWSKVPQLTNGLYPGVETFDSTPATRDVFRQGYFIGVTYKIG